MTGIWLISYLILWLLVLLLLLAVVTLARQVGMLHARLGPVGARMTNAGPEIGEAAPALAVNDIDGRELTLGSVRGKPTLLVFITTSCSACARLTAAIRTLWKSEHDKLEIALVSLYSTEEEAREFAKRHKLTHIPCTADAQAGLVYQVASPPYALLIDEQGTVRAKGVVNNSEHLESLLNVIELGHISMEDWHNTQPPKAVEAVVDAPAQ